MSAVGAASLASLNAESEPIGHGAAAPNGDVAPFALDEVTLSELQAQLAAGKVSAVSLVEKYLARIEEIDRRGPSLRSVIELNPDAPAMARALDEQRRAKGPCGPLHGIPILIKDNIATHDRMSTSAGSLALANSVAPRDAFLVERLREAGAVILGKTNLSEWANFRSSHSTSGWSGRGGQTRNPYVLDRNPSGSSSGSAVAVAANLCAAAVGTETDGSIIAPASDNGVVGLKPTVGQVSRSGIIPISRTQDTAGPMARTVADAAVLLGALAGRDPRDPATLSNPDKSRVDYTTFLDPNGLRGARIGVARETFTGHPQVPKLMEKLLAELQAGGATLIDPVELPEPSNYVDSEMEVLLYEFKAGLNAYLAELGADAPVRSMRDIIEFNEQHAADEMPWFKQELFHKAEAMGPLTDQAYLDALATCRRATREQGIDALMDHHRIDAIFCSGGGPAVPIDYAYGDRSSGGGGHGAAAVAGYPSIAVPAGFIFGLPVGVIFLGRAWSEPTLLKIAFAFEQRIKARRSPRFLQTLSRETLTK